MLLAPTEGVAGKLCVSEKLPSFIAENGDILSLFNIVTSCNTTAAAVDSVSLTLRKVSFSRGIDYCLWETIWSSNMIAIQIMVEPCFIK